MAEQGGGLQIGPMGDWPVTGNLKGKQEISSQQVSHLESPPDLGFWNL